MNAYTRIRSLFQKVYRLALGEHSSSSEQRSANGVLARRVSNVVDRIQQDRIEDVCSYFFLPLRLFVRPLLLRSGWQIVTKMAGPLQRVREPQISSGWLATATVPLEFEKMTLSMLLRMTPSGRLVGLRFVPESLAGEAHPWSLPSYAHPSRYEEQPIKLGGWIQNVRACLTMPVDKNLCPCVIMLSGSGPMDQDSTVGAIKPFKDIGYGLASRGIAVLRYDKFPASTLPLASRNDGETVSLEDEYLDYVAKALQYARSHSRVDNKAIYLLGHSLGAWVAPRVAELDQNIAGLVLLSCPARPYYHSFLRQLEYLSSRNPQDAALQSYDTASIKDQVRRADNLQPGDHCPTTEMPLGLNARYWLQIQRCDPCKILQGMPVKTVFLQGERDYQVTLADDFQPIRDRLREAKHVTFSTYATLNHGFIPGDGPSVPSEYNEPGNVDQAAVDDIADWVLRDSI